MLFRQTEKKDGDEVLRKLTSQVRVHSIAAVLRGRHFKGGFEAAGSSYEFTFLPAKASVIGRRFQLEGRLTVKGARGEPRNRDQVRATVIGTQGGIGGAPPRPQNQASGATASSDLPDVESTGITSFCGAMYLQLEPLAGSALGVPADLKRVQLNVRFAPVNDSERLLQGAFSSIVDALYGSQVNASAATSAVNDLNKLLAAT